MVPEARLEPQQAGLTPMTEGWFVVNIAAAPWMTNDRFGAACFFEGDDVQFPDVGFTLVVLRPGQVTMYHREANQEDFLILAGECLLLVEGEERALRAWDFVHCPAGTEHGFVATGEDPCVIFMTGARKGWPAKGIVYPRSELAIRHGAGVETETTSPPKAYAEFPKWQPGPPETWDGLPWG
jgi:quercetin dioxygenase-like cupin family protein